MTLDIDLLDLPHEPEYEEFILSHPESLLYASTAYQRFLSRILAPAEGFCLVARQKGRMVGALPAFVTRGRLGAVINSLPFYGSNGGVLPAGETGTAVAEQLMTAFLSLCQRENALSATVITSPFCQHLAALERSFRPTLKDHRIGQITTLPELLTSSPEFEDNLMASFHQKTRNAIRRAQKAAVAVTVENSWESWSALAALHQENLRAVGGLSKPLEVFAALWQTFRPGKDYDIFVAHRDGQVSARLLVLYFNRTAEYFTPASKEDERVHQPLSLLIYEAMKGAVRRGFRYWNWGGTWVTQDGVYHFKSRWGTTDRPYQYLIRVFQDKLWTLTRQQVAEAYPYFYVVPFAALEAHNGRATNT